MYKAGVAAHACNAGAGGRGRRIDSLDFEANTVYVAKVNQV